MSSRRFGRKRKGPQLSPEGRLPVAAYSAEELHRFLVVDAVGQHATHLPWYVLAVRRIAELEHIRVEEAHVRVVNEVQTLTGRGMPVYSGPILGQSG